jgi:acyl-CoA synthetase (AMP-forming)/AMP-acid ligase II
MDLNLTDIVVVLDRSGSMASVVDDTIGGFNSFVDRQKKGEGFARLTLVEFDHEYHVVYERRDIHEVSPLDRRSYVPRGNTALLDAIGRTIIAVRGAIAVDRPSERPGQVVFVIITDGMENASREFTRSQILEMIRAHQEEEEWEFLFFGANQDAIGEAASMGIDAARAASWKKARILHDVYAEKLAQFRARKDRGSLHLTPEDRARLESDEDANDRYN